MIIIIIINNFIRVSKVFSLEKLFGDTNDDNNTDKKSITFQIVKNMILKIIRRNEATYSMKKQNFTIKNKK